MQDVVDFRLVNGGTQYLQYNYYQFFIISRVWLLVVVLVVVVTVSCAIVLWFKKLKLYSITFGPVFIQFVITIFAWRSDFGQYNVLRLV